VSPLLLTARSRTSLVNLAEAYARLLKQDSSLSVAELAANVVRQRELMNTRLVITADDKEAMIEALEAVTENCEPADTESYRIHPGETACAPGEGIFVFSGNGCQWAGMGSTLLNSDASFSRTMMEIDEILAPLQNWSICEYMRRPAGDWNLEKTEIAQPLLFAIQIGLSRLLAHKGIVPDAVYGHSVGEVAAAHVCGALSLTDACTVIHHRSRLQGKTFGRGGMAAMNISPERARSLAEASDGRVELAAVNSAGSVTMAGDMEVLTRIEQEILAENGFCKVLPLAYPFHSRFMDDLREPLCKALTGIRPRPSALRFISTVSGKVINGEDLDANYWWHNIRRPVSFLQATECALKAGARIFLEIGSHGVLQYYLKDAIRSAKVRACSLSTLKRDSNDVSMIETAWRQAYVLRWPIEWDRVYPQPERKISLPTYAWDREHLWLQPTSEHKGFLSARRVHPLLGWRVPGTDNAFENTIDTQLVPWVAGHVVSETILFPAAAFIELCHASYREHDPQAKTVEIINLDLRRPLLLGSAPAKKTRVEIESDGLVRLSSKTQLTDEDWLLHGTARAFASDAPRNESVDLKSLQTDEHEVPAEILYETARDMGLAYTPPFTPVVAAWKFENTVLVELALSDTAAAEGMLIAPPLVDGAFQSLFLLLAEHLPRHHRNPYLPSWFGRMIFFASGVPRYGQAQLMRASTRSVVASFVLYDERGCVLARFEDCRFRRADWRIGSQPDVQAYRTEFEPYPHPSAPRIPCVPSPQDMAQSLVPIIDDLAKRLDRAEYYATILPLCQAATIALAHEVVKPLAELGPIGLDDGLNAGLLKADQVPYMIFILELLRTHGLVEQQDGKWIVCKKSHLPDSLSLWRTIVADYPAYLSEAVLVGRIGLHLRNILRGDMDAETIMGENQGATLEHFYSNTPSIRLINETTNALIRQAIRLRPQGTRIRILEVGAAPGGLLSTIISALDPRRCEYVVSDRDADALEKLETVWGDRDGLSFHVLDMEHPQNFDDALFDMIIAGQCLHEAESIDNALRGCLSLLAPGGMLVGLTRGPSDLQDMILGVDPRWWSRSLSPEEPASRLLSRSSWDRALRDAGFEQVHILHEPCNDHEPDTFICLGAKPKPVDSVDQLPAMTNESTWLIASDASRHDDSNPEAARLAEILKNSGARIRFLALTEQETPYEAEEPLPQTHEQWTCLFHSLAQQGPIECVHFLGFDSRPECSGPELTEISLRRLNTATTMVQAWIAAGCPKCRFWLVTGGCQDVDGENLFAVMSQAPLWGFGRVLQNEIAGLQTRLIDIHGDPTLTMPALAREMACPQRDMEVVLVDDRRYRPKVASFDPTPVRPSPKGLANAIRLVFDSPGRFDRLYWRQISLSLPGSGEVQIQNMATGLNFRDVMWAMGMLPDEALENGFSGPTMGLECSGIVSAVGPDVQSVQVGDEVVCFAPACFSSYVTTTENAVAPKPATFSHEEAATIPVAFFTAYYAIKHLAAAEPGERILINGAAGGVGLAAIQIAQHLGLEIYATAGSNEKRDFLKLLGVEHIFDSRSLRFTDDILNQTHGQGVDIVLNSLYGKAMAKGLDALRPFGRFLELGKRDFYEDNPLFLRPFRNNISYFGIDVDQMLVARPLVAKRLFTEIMELFARRILRPLPHRIFSRANAAEAFRIMQHSRHMGKLVVSFDEHEQGVRAAPLATPLLPVDTNGAYLITGGLGGFGLKTAERLADDGAKEIILLGRSGISSPAAENTVEKLRQQGITIQIVQADVSDAQALQQALDQTLKKTAPLKGVIHAAGVLDDAVIANQTPDTMKRVWTTKALGAFNLHQLTLDHRLDFFVLFSSATTLLGNPGQANYVAANCALETLASYRRSKGLPALAVGWGPIEDAGMLVGDPKTMESLKSILGVTPISTQKALDLLERLHWREVTAPAIFSIDWKKIRHLPAAATGRFNGLLKGAGLENGSSGQTIMHEIAGKSRDEALAVLVRNITKEAASIMRIPVSRIDVNAAVAEFGMDSLMAVELGIALEERFGLEAPTISLAGGASVTTIAERFLKQMTGGTSQDGDAHLLSTMQLQHNTQLSPEISNRIHSELTGKESSHD
jgi:NADPH:quinone reductase-like Zn-dependent oxidoreductase/NAD(P)-dependent dehydrogenase (short-subunit alcohol dehydrogenase family)/SAM-dependent methyltransferase/acyl carrier protein